MKTVKNRTGNTIRCSVYGYMECDLLSNAHDPYYIAGFFREPEISLRELPLACGQMLCPGERIACLDGERSSAGFDMLYPVAPVLFAYQGTTLLLDGTTLVLWLPVDERTDEVLLPKKAMGYSALYFAHALIESDSGINLVYTNRAGAGRIIDTDYCARSHTEAETMMKERKR